MLSTIKRIDGNYDMDHVRNLAKLLDAPRPRTPLDLNYINEVKDKALESLLYHINLENCLYSPNGVSSKLEFERKSTFKAYICKGNNGSIVKTILKKRWWWTLVEKCDPTE